MINLTFQKAGSTLKDVVEKNLHYLNKIKSDDEKETDEKVSKRKKCKIYCQKILMIQLNKSLKPNKNDSRK